MPPAIMRYIIRKYSSDCSTDDSLSEVKIKHKMRNCMIWRFIGLYNHNYIK